MPGADLLLMEKRASSSPAAPAAATPDKPTPGTRKSSKPIMEKRRRARINESLAQLKGLILDALQKDSSRHSKLEKADILEMTVKHLRGLQRAQRSAVLNTDPSVLGKYRAGFSECVNEVTRFLSTCEGVNAEVRTRLLGHLAGCMSQISAIRFPAAPQQPQPPPAAPGSQPVASFGQALVQVPATGALPKAGSGAPCKTVPREAPQVFGGFHLVPASDGQFAFLIPNAAFAPHGSNAAAPLFASTGAGSGGAPPSTNAVSPGSGAPSLPSDSVWRPW
nr:PREDICTED: transcription factor HES-1 [Anolis carolinensis]|eukprot:XP_008119437.1 PREDICTED: transcription factor HES-1 [Anolis carolinensis]